MSRAEVWAGLTYPTVVYPLLESVLAARAGRGFAEQRAYVAGADGPLHRCRRDASVRVVPEARDGGGARDADTVDNRLISEPYTKRMNAFPFVDQAAALVMCSLEVAQDAGVDDRAIFVWSGADAYEVRFPTARPELGRAVGLHAPLHATFAAASVGTDDIGAFDFYCCFPSAVEMAADAFGIALDDPPASPSPAGCRTSAAREQLHDARDRDAWSRTSWASAAWACAAHPAGS